MKQEPVIAQYQKVVNAFNAVDAEINALIALLPDAPVKEGEPPAKMVTPDMSKCLYVGVTHIEDGRLRIGAVFHDMLRYTEEFVAQQQERQAAELAAKLPPAPMPTPDFTPKASDGQAPENPSK